MDTILKNKSDITGTHWVEFNISGTPNSYKHWADDSKYLDEYAYEFFTDVFESVAENFNYYGDTRFSKEQLISLTKEVENRIGEFDSLTTPQDIIEFSKKTSYAINLTQAIEKLCNKQDAQLSKLVVNLKNLGYDLLDLLNHCIEQDKVLIVLGL